MKKYAKITAILLAASMLCACEKIPDDPDLSSGAESSVTSSDTSSEQDPDIYAPNDPVIVKQSYVKKFEAEKGSFNGTARDEYGELQNAEKGGYVALAKGQHLTQIATVTTSQFYRVIIAARSKTGASIKLQIGDSIEGAYFLMRTTVESEGDEFGLYAVDNIYIPVGMNTLSFTVENGAADIDYIIIEDSAAVSGSLYNIGNACVCANATEKTVLLMRLLAENYGNVTFTAQNVSCGTNAEIDAVYRETKRYPAIRTGELALAMKKDDHSAEVIKNDLALAREWDSNGGICSYMWHWYSPNAVRGTNSEDFELYPALNGTDPSELALLDEGGVQLQINNDLLTQDAAALLEDLDKLAQTLKPLCDADIPILFEPIPDGDSGLFWWGSDAESYRKLWVLIFDRLTKYNGIQNLIWVWNNSDFEYYPGDNYVDIIGQSFYEKTSSSFAGRFGALAENPKTGRKAIAVTACASLPSIDNMSRDNAMWLWAAPDSGEYTIDNTGRLTEAYTKKSLLRAMYNNRKCITLDELAELGYVNS
ncbi:MAG: glycoside hydrolase family 26 protein [Oscillospiraceae bacterium]|nr:glycoside hydrolase family 26 protein [Oscillospiraceae bacterium]